MSKEHTSTCRICGRLTAAGTTECPACQEHTNRYAERIYPGNYRPIWDNPSHDGYPTAIKFIDGPYAGQVMKVVLQ